MTALLEIRDYRLAFDTFDGTAHEVPVNEPATGAALHGTASFEHWAVQSIGPQSVFFALELPRTEGYPFDVRLSARYLLDADEGLFALVSAVNEGSTDAPVGLSAHPYLTCGAPVDECVFGLDASQVLTVDEKMRPADLLPVGYFHVVFTLPAEVAAIAFHNRALVYDLLFRTASETMMTIAADPKHLGARIGITAVLHSWGSAMTYHPHVHMIVPGGGIALDGVRWVSSRPAFLLPVRVLGALFRRLFLTRLMALHDAGKLGFFGPMAPLADRRAFLRHLSPVRKKRWVVYAKPPFAGPAAVLAYLSRYTHRVAISNRRLLAFDETGVTFRYKDYRRSGAGRQQVMTIAADEFIRRFLLHVLPRGFHRIRHYGLLASSARKASLELARRLLAVAPDPANDDIAEPDDYRPPCPCCGGRMAIIEAFKRWRQPRAPPAMTPMIRKVTS